MAIETVGEDCFFICRLTVDQLNAGLMFNKRTHETLIALGLLPCTLGSCLPGLFKNSITEI